MRLTWGAAFAAITACGPTAAASYPVKPVRLVTTFAPGGGADIVARAIGTRDLAPVSLLVINPQLLTATAAIQVSSVKELIAHLKVRPGAVNYASVGQGSCRHTQCGDRRRAR